MKKFFNEFKQFISRGNVIDLAVGIIIGSAFTAIVTALTSKIIQPLINFLIYAIMGGKGQLEGVYTFLIGSASDIENAIYIDWGAFISAIINFLLIAFVLFLIVKTCNRINSNGEKMKKGLALAIITKEERAEMKEMGLNYKVPADCQIYREKKEKELIEEKKALEAKQKAEEEEAKKHTTEYLLEEIKNILEKK